MIELPNLSQIGARLGERVALGMGLIDFENHIHQGWALWVRVSLGLFDCMIIVFRYFTRARHAEVDVSLERLYCCLACTVRSS